MIFKSKEVCRWLMAKANSRLDPYPFYMFIQVTGWSSGDSLLNSGRLLELDILSPEPVRHNMQNGPTIWNQVGPFAVADTELAPR